MLAKYDIYVKNYYLVYSIQYCFTQYREIKKCPEMCMIIIVPFNE